jgi:hypothetical protein
MGSYWALKGHPEQAMGIILIESTQIRWFSRWSGGGGWSGRSEAQRRPRVSKLRAKGLSHYHSNETVVGQPEEGPVGQIKGYSHDMFTQKRRAEKQLLVSLKKGKRQPAREKAPQIKRKNCLL